MASVVTYAVRAAQPAPHAMTSDHLQCPSCALQRDLKPQNLLLFTRFVPGEPFPLLKIADFGFARSLQPQTLADTLCGSPLYMAPEILQAQRYGAKADLWSVGVILFELVAGVYAATRSCAAIGAVWPCVLQHGVNEQYLDLHRPGRCVPSRPDSVKAPYHAYCLHWHTGRAALHWTERIILCLQGSRRLGATTTSSCCTTSTTPRPACLMQFLRGCLAAAARCCSSCCGASLSSASLSR
jgi:serine/threonine protein kinase